MRQVALSVLLAALLGCPAASSDDAARTGLVPTDASANETGFADGCGTLEVKYTQQKPAVVVLIDMSGSMRAPLEEGGPSRWAVLRAALVLEGAGVVSRLENEVYFGALLYRSFDGYAGGRCPDFNWTPIALGSAARIRSAIDAAAPYGGTPTGDGVREASVMLSNFRAPDRSAVGRYVILVTDGSPDTCTQPSPDDGLPDALASLRATTSKGILTYVVGVGPDIALGALSAMAEAGGTHRPHSVATLSELVARVEEAVNGARSCSFTLRGRVTDGDGGIVTIDGTVAKEWVVTVPADGSDEDSVVMLYGDDCVQVQKGERRVVIAFPCARVVLR